MTVITAEDYSLSFGHLADVIPCSSAFAVLSPTKAQQLGAAWYKLAELHGVTAALNRLMPEHKYAGTPQGGQHHLTRKIGSLTISRTVDVTRDEPAKFRVYAPLNGSTAFPLLVSQEMIIGGPWLRELAVAAEKAPFNRFEAGAASFHKWLKAQP